MLRPRLTCDLRYAMSFLCSVFIPPGKPGFLCKSGVGGLQILARKVWLMALAPEAESSGSLPRLHLE